MKSKKPELKAIKVPPVLHGEIEAESEATGMKMYALVEQAWRVYKRQLSVEDTRHTRERVKAEARMREPNEKHVEKLREILRSGNRSAKSAIVHGIAVMHEYVRRLQEDEKSKGKSQEDQKG